MKRVDIPMVPKTQSQESLRQTSLGQNFTLHESFVCVESIEEQDQTYGNYCKVGIPRELSKVRIDAWKAMSNYFKINANFRKTPFLPYV